ncbi:MAG: ferritin-like domain-containing protein [Epsilonproteobacteria bacterium]|nr:ferritin-like domain-containing protein [Campylobacterota bacterium]
MNFYKDLETALTSSNINTKELIVNEALKFCKENSSFGFESPKVFDKPSYSDICKIVKGYEVRSRKRLDTKEGLIALLHSIAHIEYSAIDLALDAAYRFDMPNEFKIDWLNVAADEIRHFKMIEEILKELGSFYGDLPVHRALFDIGKRTNSSLLDRMAVVPRYHEASGLDVNRVIINKIKANSKLSISKKVVDALEVIYIDEIEHVKKGDKWFKYLCHKKKLNYKQTYIDIIKRYNLVPKAKGFNIEARKMAGFSCEELIELGAKKC